MTIISVIASAVVLAGLGAGCATGLIMCINWIREDLNSLHTSVR